MSDNKKTVEQLMGKGPPANFMARYLPPDMQPAQLPAYFPEAPKFDSVAADFRARLNKYGQFNLHNREVPANYRHLPGEQAKGFCDGFKLPCAPALVGFTERGVYQVPVIDGVVIPVEAIGDFPEDEWQHLLKRIPKPDPRLKVSGLPKRLRIIRGHMENAKRIRGLRTRFPQMTPDECVRCACWLSDRGFGNSCNQAPEPWSACKTPTHKAVATYALHLYTDYPQLKERGVDAPSLLKECYDMAMEKWLAWGGEM